MQALKFTITLVAMGFFSISVACEASGHRLPLAVRVLGALMICSSVFMAIPEIVSAAEKWIAYLPAAEQGAAKLIARAVQAVIAGSTLTEIPDLLERASSLIHVSLSITASIPLAAFGWWIHDRIYPQRFYSANPHFSDWVITGLAIVAIGIPLVSSCTNLYYGISRWYFSGWARSGWSALVLSIGLMLCAMTVVLDEFMPEQTDPFIERALGVFTLFISLVFGVSIVLYGLWLGLVVP